MDFIVELPLLKGCSQIWVVVDHFTKMVHFIPIKDDVKKVQDLVWVFAKKI
jgi:hypothetical protein